MKTINKKLTILDGPNKKGEYTFSLSWDIKPRTEIVRGKRVTISKRGQIFRTKDVDQYVE